MTKDATRSQIVAAARKRFAHFGYAKTAMAEIAADCAMSPGNLYRFFPGKLDIAEAIAADNYDDHLAFLRKAASMPGLSARERLFNVLRDGMRRAYRTLDKDPRALEMVALIAREKPAYADDMREKEAAILAVLLAEGRETGEFSFEDAADTAAALQSATVRFRNPALWAGHSLARLEMGLERVLRLLLNGLSSRG